MLEQALLVLMLAGAAPVADATKHTEKIAQVKAGRLQEAKASWWGFDKADSTKCLQEALDSGVKKLVVDNVGSDWVIGPIGVPSNVEVIFADGVVVRAKKGEFRKKTDKLFNIEGQANVTLRGEGKVLLVMNKSDYQNPELYQPGGHRHTVNIFNSQNVLVQNLTLMSSGGDGVYVGSSGTGEGAKNVTLDRLICEDHHRLAIAVTGAENLLLKDINFTNKPVHRYEGKPYRAPLEVVVWCPTRTQVDKFGIPFDDIAEYTLAAAETGVYRFEIDARMQTVSIETDAPGQAVTPAAESLYLFGCSGQLYFHVPAAVKQIKIEAGGSPSENSSVFLLDPKGKEVDSGVRLDGSKILEYIRPDASRAEVWSIKFTASKLFLRVAAPLLPLFSSDPANLLVPTSPPSSSLRTEKSACRPPCGTGRR